MKKGLDHSHPIMLLHIFCTEYQVLENYLSKTFTLGEGKDHWVNFEYETKHILGVK